MLSVKKALDEATIILKKSGITSAALDARTLLSFVLQTSVTNLLLKQDSHLSAKEEEKFFNLLKRRGFFEPIAYLTLEKEFYSNLFFINNDVLIPRPETELLIDITHKLYKNKNANLKFLELGTGSGCIAITLLLEFPKSYVVATDISIKALEVAQRNTSFYNVSNRISLIHSDWFDNLPKKKFDLIISNPPYIAENEKHLMSQETLLYEPQKALFSQDYGLSDYKKIAQQAYEYLNDDGFILLEIGFQQLSDVIDIFSKNNFLIENFYYDINNIARSICFKK